MMPLGTEVGLSPGHIVYGDPGPSKVTYTAPNFRPISIVAKRWPISATAEHLLSVLWSIYPSVFAGRVHGRRSTPDFTDRELTRVVYVYRTLRLVRRPAVADN